MSGEYLLLTKYSIGTLLSNNKRVYSVFSDFEPEHFWQWTDFQSYLECTVCFVAVGSFVMYLMLKYDPFVETVGFLAVFTEAMLGMPQFYRNFTNKSTYGMR